MYKQNLVSICFPSGIFILFRFIYNRFVFPVEPNLPISRFEDSQIRFQEFKCNRSRRRNKDLRAIKIYKDTRKILLLCKYQLFRGQLLWMFLVENVILRLPKTRKSLQMLIISDKCKKCCKRVIETIKAIQCWFFSLQKINRRSLLWSVRWNRRSLLKNSILLFHPRDHNKDLLFHFSEKQTWLLKIITYSKQWKGALNVFRDY